MMMTHDDGSVCRIPSLNPILSFPLAALPGGNGKNSFKALGGDGTWKHTESHEGGQGHGV